MTSNSLQTVLDRAAELLGHRFSDPELLRSALRHASSADNRLHSNERMEFLGDAVLGLVVCEHLYRTHPDFQEGDMTKVKSAVVSRKICSRISEQLDLVSMMNLGKGMAGRSALPSSVTAAVYESLIGAIFLDGGMEPARRFILATMGPYIAEASASAHHQNFKSVLQQHAQKHLSASPVYTVLDEKGPDHSKAFEVCVIIDGRRFGSAWANTKKDAEQKAALLALQELGLVEPSQA